MIEMAVTTGLRQSELLGLQWGDIDWQSSRLHVRRALREGRFYETKSRHAHRIVELPASLLHALKIWRLKCPKGEHDLMFPNREGNPTDAANLIHRGFEPAVRRARGSARSVSTISGTPPRRSCWRTASMRSQCHGCSEQLADRHAVEYSHAIPKERAGLTTACEPF